MFRSIAFSMRSLDSINSGAIECFFFLVLRIARTHAHTQLFNDYDNNK